MSIDIQTQAAAQRKRNSTQTAGDDKTTALPPTTAGWKWLVGLSLLGAGALAAFNFAPTLGGEDSRRMLTHEVTRGSLVVSVTEQGKLESSSNVEIKCRVKGGSTVLWVIEAGTEVKPGDELVRLDQSTIEDNISQQKIAYENAVSAKATSESDVAVAKIGIEEYLSGTFRSQQTTFQKDVVIAESNLKSARNALQHAEKMFRKGYTSKLDLEAQQDAVAHAELELQVKQTDLEALEKFTKAKELETLEGLLNISEANLAANVAALELEEARLRRAEDQLKNCVIVAERPGLVILPSAAAWKEQPDIEEGASVREDQVLLVMPDLESMQVEVGIHESKVDRLRVGMPARVQLQDDYVDGEVAEIASVTKGGGWWNGNIVSYDTIVKLENNKALKPGMSVAVEVFLAKYTDVLSVPVAAVLELDGEFFCWVDNGGDAPEKRSVKIGDSNDTYVLIEEGLNEGDQVVLNPRDFVEEAESAALESIVDRASPQDVPEFDASKGEGRKKPEAKKASGITGAAILKLKDKNKDGALTEDELDENGKKDFKKNDTNGDGKLDEKELDAAIKRAAAGKKK